MTNRIARQIIAANRAYDAALASLEIARAPDDIAASFNHADMLRERISALMARRDYLSWRSACRACVRDQRRARSHKSGSARAEQMFWAEYRDRIVFRAGYQNSPNGLSRIAGPMGAYWCNRNWHADFNALRYAWAFRGVAWYRATLASMANLRGVVQS